MFEVGLRASLKCFEKTLLLCEVGERSYFVCPRIANCVVRKEGRMCTPQLDTTELVILEGRKEGFGVAFKTTVQYAGLADWIIILCRLSSSSEPSVINCVCDGAREFGLGLIREQADVSLHSDPP
jgi:hypothetical protein